jgi:hypothetical protein
MGSVAPNSEFVALVMVIGVVQSDRAAGAAGAATAVSDLPGNIK